MSVSLWITVIIVVGVSGLLAGATHPFKNERRQRIREDQMASEKPFQMGNDPTSIDSYQDRY